MQVLDPHGETANPGSESLTVAIRKLKPAVHGEVLCYPGKDLTSFYPRVQELRSLDVSEIIFEGSSKVGKLGVLGKGCVSIVLKARIKGESEVIALKCRRVDANRDSMQKDYELQKFANSFGIGPRVIRATRDFFAMELIDGLKIGKWFESLRTRSSKRFIRALIRDCLTQCFILDKQSLDHGELSTPLKHILIRRNESGQLVPKAVIIDYESAGRERKVSNFTSVAQFFFLGSWQSHKIRRILGTRNRDSRLIELLKKYKLDPSSENFDNFLNYVRC